MACIEQCIKEKLQTLKREAPIKILLMVQDPLAKLEDDKIWFMSIDNSEYQDRKDPLQRAIDLVKRVKEIKTDKDYRAEMTWI